jgi:large subunit ribosomal protein L15
MQKNTLIAHTPRKHGKTVGRGGKRGKTAGRGTKGQSARAGNKKRPELRDIIKKLPKLRGYKFNSVHDDNATVTIAQLEKSFNDGEKITPGMLIAKGIVNTRNGKVPHVKILAKGNLTKKLFVSKFSVSAGAREIITKAGGKVE